MKKTIFVLILSFLLVGNAFASAFITWFPEEFVCPVDKEKNTFMVVGSYGSYIYEWPSKYQCLFFPQTESQAFYLCKKCHLATFMWDFDKLPKEKLDAVRDVLKDVRVSKSFKQYGEIPTTERIEIMEKVYSVLDKNDEWWESFYRIKGYHYGQYRNFDKASEARKRSLGLLKKAMEDPKSSTPKKLLYYVSGGMKHFTGDDAGAIEDLQKGLATKYVEEKLDENELKAAEAGLNQRITEYIQRIKSEKNKPRMLEGTEEEHDH